MSADAGALHATDMVEMKIRIENNKNKGSKCMIELF